jgi:hypothetical protein
VLVEANAVQVAVPMVDVGPDPVGQYKATSKLVIAPPLAAAEELAATWRDLTDCPLDPAQRWLDCTIDALGPTSDADPLDCVPATTPGGDGALGDDLGALRRALAGPTADYHVPQLEDGDGQPLRRPARQGLYGSPCRCRSCASRPRPTPRTSSTPQATLDAGAGGRDGQRRLRDTHADRSRVRAARRAAEWP